MSRKVIRDFIRQADSLDDSRREAYFDTIVEVYEDSTHTAAERVATLESDTLWLLIEYRRIVEAKDNSPEEKQKHRIAQSNLWQLLSALIASTADKGIYLSEDFIKKYDKVEFVGDDFGNYVRETYSVREWKEPQHKAPEALQQPVEGNDGELAGNGNETRPDESPDDDEPQYIELPDILKISDKAQPVFTEAVAKGWMEEYTDGTADWVGVTKPNKNGVVRAKWRQLAFMCGEVYGYIPPKQGREYGNQGDAVPWTDLQQYFNIDGQINLAKILSGVYEANKRKPTWQNVIREMIKSVAP